MRAELFDGSVIEFEDGTSEDVVLRVVREQTKKIAASHEQIGTEKGRATLTDPLAEPVPQPAVRRDGTRAKTQPFVGGDSKVAPDIGGAGGGRGFVNEAAGARAAAEAAKPKPYANRDAAIDDAVNLLDEGANPQSVYDQFRTSPMQITRPEIEGRGVTRGSPFFAPQRARAGDGAMPEGAVAAPAGDRMRGFEPSDAREVLNVGRRGFEQLKGTLDAGLYQAGVTSGPAFAEQLREGQRRTQGAMAPSGDVAAGLDRLQRANGSGEWAPVLRAVANPSNWKALGSMLGESLVASAPVMLAGSLATALGGAAVGMPVTAAVSFAQEYASSFGEEMEKRGVSASDPVAVARLLEDPSFRQDVDNRGRIRGAAVGAFDAVTMGLAGALGRSLAKASQAGTLTTGRALRGAATGAALETTGGAAGEALAQAGVGDNKPLDVVVEALAEAPGGVANVAAGAFHANKLQGTGAGQVAAAIDQNADAFAQYFAAPPDKTAPTQARAASVQRLDEMAAAFGLNPRALTAAREQAQSLPADDVPGFLARAAVAMNKRQLFAKPLEPSAVAALAQRLQPTPKEGSSAVAAPEPKPAAQAASSEAIPADDLITDDQGPEDVNKPDLAVPARDDSGARDGRGDDAVRGGLAVGPVSAEPGPMVSPAAAVEAGAGPADSVADGGLADGAVTQLERLAERFTADRRPASKTFAAVLSGYADDVRAGKMTPEQVAPQIQAYTELLASGPPAVAQSQPDAAQTHASGTQAPQEAPPSPQITVGDTFTLSGKAYTTVKAGPRSAVVADADGSRRTVTADGQTWAAMLEQKASQASDQQVKVQPAQDQAGIPAAGPVASRAKPVPAPTQVGSAPNRPNAQSKNAGAKGKNPAAQEKDAKRAAYFTPGNVVRGYGGFNEVLSYAPPDQTGRWSVKVQEVRKDADGQWVRVGKPQDARTHATEPDARALQQGPETQLPPAPGERVVYTEPRADGRPHQAADARGVALQPGPQPVQVPDVSAAAPKPKDRAAARGTARHPQTVMGSRLLADVSMRHGGLDPSWLSEFSFRVETKAQDRGGRLRTQWRNPLIPGVGKLFRQGGTQDLQALAEMMEAEGYLAPGTVEADAKEAGEQAKALIRAALNRDEPQTLDQQTAARQAEQDAERADHYAQMDAESAAELEAERAAIMAEVRLSEDDVGAVDDGMLWEAQGSADEAGLMRALGFSEQEINDEVRKAQTRGAGRDQARRDGEPGPVETPDADRGRASRADETGAQEALTLESPTPDILRERAERAQAGETAEQRKKAAKQERLRKEAEARDLKARADRTVDDFELGQSADRQMSGTGDLFDAAPAEDSPKPALPAAPSNEPTSPFDNNHAAFEGKTLEQQVKVAETGEVAVIRMDAAKALRDLDAREAALTKLRDCLKKAA